MPSIVSSEDDDANWVLLTKRLISPWVRSGGSSYLFEVGGLVEQLHKVFGLLVVGLGPGTGLLHCFFDHFETCL